MRIGIIGCGNMGEAIIKRQKARSKKQNLLASETRKERRDYIRKCYRIPVLKDNLELVRSSDLVILAVKPQDVRGLLEKIARSPDSTAHFPLFISIAAGISTHFVEGILKKARVIRVMPNMNALIGKGISALCKGRYAQARDMENAKRIFRGLGEVIEVQEKDLNAITALSGSGPAYFFYFTEQLIEAGVRLGLKREIAKSLVIHTGLGAFEMLVQGGDARELREKVSSKGGTTESALKIFSKRGIDKIIIEAIEGAANRAKELEE